MSLFDNHGQDLGKGTDVESVCVQPEWSSGSHSANCLGNTSPGWEPQTQITKRGDNSGECRLRDLAAGRGTTHSLAFPFWQGSPQPTLPQTGSLLHPTLTVWGQGADGVQGSCPTPVRDLGDSVVTGERDAESRTSRCVTAQRLPSVLLFACLL